MRGTIGEEVKRGLIRRWSLQRNAKTVVASMPDVLCFFLSLGAGSSNFLSRDSNHRKTGQSRAPFHELRPDTMDEDRDIPADALPPQDRTPNSNNTALQSPKRIRDEVGEQDAQDHEETNEHGNKTKNKYRQRTFQHGSRKYTGDKRKNLGRGEYLYVFSVLLFRNLLSALTQLLCSTN